jgi:hypothetical protein
MTLSEDESKPWQINDIAVELGINDSSWSATVATASIPTGSNPPPNHFYDFLINVAEKLIDGEIDQNSYEDCLRVNFGTQAYLLFTLDKVVSALIKQVFYRLPFTGWDGCSYATNSGPHCHVRRQKRAGSDSGTAQQRGAIDKRPHQIPNQGAAHLEYGRQRLQG